MILVVLVFFTKTENCQSYVIPHTLRCESQTFTGIRDIAAAIKSYYQNCIITKHMVSSMLLYNEDCHVIC